MKKGFTIPVLDHGYVRYIDHMGTDLRMVEAARISYKSPSKGEDQDKKLLKYLITNRHTSPLEMCKITFNVKLPIFVMRQWVRHRMQNLNEMSARYTQLPSEFYLPNAWRKQDTKNKQGSSGEFNDEENEDISKSVSNFYLHAYDTYELLLDKGVSRELARMVLPVSIYTEIYSSWDINNLLKFFKLRDDSHAQSEIQEYARALKQITKELFPWTMEIYEELNES